MNVCLFSRLGEFFVCLDIFLFLLEKRKQKVRFYLYLSMYDLQITNSMKINHFYLSLFLILLFPFRFSIFNLFELVLNERNENIISTKRKCETTQKRNGHNRQHYFIYELQRKETKRVAKTLCILKIHRRKYKRRNGSFIHMAFIKTEIKSTNLTKNSDFLISFWKNNILDGRRLKRRNRTYFLFHSI